jgi:hypothetical protein
VVDEDRRVPLERILEPDLRSHEKQDEDAKISAVACGDAGAGSDAVNLRFGRASTR